MMLESGTKTLSLPSELYGCPYPANPALPPGTCAAPDLCNCNAGICFGTCKGDSRSIPGLKVMKEVCLVLTVSCTLPKPLSFWGQCVLCRTCR